jgi:hypothetical protein
MWNSPAILFFYRFFFCVSRNRKIQTDLFSDVGCEHDNSIETGFGVA